MKLFSAVNTDIVEEFCRTVPDVKLNVLVSIPYVSGVLPGLLKLKAEGRIGSLALDSGAYTVNHGKAVVTLAQYAQFLKLHGSKFDTVFSFDSEFDNPQANLDSQMLLESMTAEQPWGKPVPTVHSSDDPLSEFEMMVEMGYRHIAFGSNFHKRAEHKKLTEQWPQIKAIRKAKGVTVHFFGWLGLEVLTEFEPDSADSSRHAQAPLRGFICHLAPDPKKPGTPEKPGAMKVHKIYMEEREDTPSGATTYTKFVKEIEPKFPAGTMRLTKLLHGVFGYKRENLVNNVRAKQLVNLYHVHQLQEYVTNAIAKAALADTSSEGPTTA